MDVISLFAGCGGLDLGFKQAGFNIIWANEFDKSISPTYKYNHGTTILNTEDIRNIKIEDIPDCDGIIGGPPCQSWSEGGKGLGIKDARGKLFYEYIRIVLGKHPKFFVIENVRGILAPKHREAFLDFTGLLEKGGYNLNIKLLNAANYKIPQDRFRLFIVGIDKAFENKFKFPLENLNEKINLRQAIGDLPLTPRPFVNEIVQNENSQCLNHDYYNGPYDFKYMARNRVRGWDEVSFTIQAKAGNIPLHPQAPKMKFISSTLRTFDKEKILSYRRLSIRECARIQTFPDSFRFMYHKIKDGYKMVGNAVPPRLAKVLANEIMLCFKNNITHKDILVGLIPSLLLDKAKSGKLNFYYFGKTFPKGIVLSEISYFMPYIKGTGCKDLYKITQREIKPKKDIDPGSNDFSSRLVFHLEFVKTLYPEYKKIPLRIHHCYSLLPLK